VKRKFIFNFAQKLNTMTWFIIIVVLIVIAVVSQSNKNQENPSRKSVWNDNTGCVRDHFLQKKQSEISHISLENIDFVEQLYGVDMSNPDFDDIVSIQCEDDEVMEELENKIANFEVCSKEDLHYWYEMEGKDMKIYTDKYLKKRFRQKMKDEDFI
jgi:hypothetical protein